MGSQVMISEICSPGRVTEWAMRKGWTVGSSMDIKMGWNCLRKEDLYRAEAKLRSESPQVFVGAPPCTARSLLQHLGKGKHNEE